VKPEFGCGGGIMKLIRTCLKKTIFALFILTAFPNFAFAQGDKAKLRLTVVLTDKELNQKPVPKQIFTLRRVGANSIIEPIEVKTGFDGLAEVDLMPGRYKLATPQPVEFQGKRYSWEMEINLTQSPTRLELSNDNATLAEGPVPDGRLTDNLTKHFKQLQASVVTVWSEIGHGTGFFVDGSGLILTNQHVIGPSEYLAVQYDDKSKLPAVLLASDAEKDIAVIWADISKLSAAIVAPIAKSAKNENNLVEGERVFTIGSPLSQRKIMTTGIASKVEARAILSDININPGNSGGPLFNSLGQVVGITTFAERDRGGPGISGIIRIEEAMPILRQAREKMQDKQKPNSDLLPVDPTDTFPLDALKEAIDVERFKTDAYIFDSGDFDVAVITPILQYRLQESEKVRAGKEKAKRTKNQKDAIKGTFKPVEDLKSWAEYAGAYKPVIFIKATPKLRETLGSVFTRAMVGVYAAPAKMRFKTDFYKMRLLCGGKEIQPIHPGKIAHVIDVRNPFINATDATYEGFYSYPFDGITGSCGQVRLELFSEKNPEKAISKDLSSKTIEQVISDFQPYRSRQKAL